METRHRTARVALTGNSDASVAKAAEAFGTNVLAIRSDAGDVAAQQLLADQIRQALGGLDAVFLNAGILDFRPLEQWDEAGFDRSFAVNLKGPFFLIRALLPILGNPSSIVLMASINGHIGMPASSIYSATKAGMASIARTLSGELIGRGIRVNSVSPGPIATPLHDGETEDQRKQLLAQIPAGRMGRPSEVAEAVVFLASDESAFTVGSEIVIDGGMTNL